MNTQRWFMSYCYARPHHRPRDGGPTHHGSCVYTGEHPVAKILRWNATYTDKLHVLLFFTQLDEAVPDLDVGI